MGKSLKRAIWTNGAPQKLISALSAPRFGKYREASKGSDYRAVKLYILNSRVSAAVFVDLHYIEVSLRNRFHEALADHFGSNWFSDTTFLDTLDSGAKDIVQKACRKASGRNGRTPVPGKVVAELSFGFWVGLADRRREHSLWVPCLHRAFAPRSAPRRSDFSRQFEALRKIRNRIAHHEPIFHSDLVKLQADIKNATMLIAPEVWPLIKASSTLKREVMSLTRYKRRNQL